MYVFRVERDPYPINPISLENEPVWEFVFRMARVPIGNYRCVDLNEVEDRLRELRQVHEIMKIEPIYLVSDNPYRFSLDPTYKGKPLPLLGYAILPQSNFREYTNQDRFGGHYTEKWAQFYLQRQLQEYEQFLNGEMYFGVFYKIENGIATPVSMQHSIYKHMALEFLEIIPPDADGFSNWLATWQQIEPGWYDKHGNRIEVQWEVV